MANAFQGERGLDVARRALEAMAELGVSPSPENYAVWVNHMAGEAPELTKALNAHLEMGAVVNDALCEKLHAQHLAGASLSDEVLNTGQEMEAELAATISTLQSAGRNAQSYGDTLRGASGALDKAVSAKTLNALVRELREQTQQQLEYARDLEKKLEDSTGNVRHLQGVLEATRKEAEEAREQAYRDALTGISNRLHFDTTIQSGVTAAKRTRKPFSLILLDIDHFKRFNDTWGHQTGDQIIRFVAKTIQMLAGKEHVVARYGGEEFAVIAPQTDAKAAVKLAERVRAEVEAKQLMRKSTSESLGKVTVSIGVAEMDPEDTVESLIERTDRRLYASKRGGRNQVTAKGNGEARPEPKEAA